MNDTAGAPGKPLPLLELRGVSRRYGAVRAVEPTDLTLNSGEFFALLGPSGCGKTTLLRMIAGFEPPDGGRILFEGKDITALPPHLRPFNMMFQSYALFPHLSVFDNVAFGLRRAGVSRSGTRARVEEMLRLVKLEGYGARGVHQLSGGQRQRVALARALARRPRLLLLDEPMAALDKSLRESTQFELMALQKALGLTFCVVTHDQDEAMMMANRIGVMEAGRLAQIGTPSEIYETPANRAVAAFVGDINLFDATVQGREGAQLLLSVPALGATFRDDEGLDIPPGTTVTFAIRPEKIAVSAQGGEMAATPPNRLSGKIADIAYLGDWTVYRVSLSSGQIVRVSRANAQRRIAQPLAAGDAVEIGFSDDAGMVLLS